MNIYEIQEKACKLTIALSELEGQFMKGIEDMLANHSEEVVKEAADKIINNRQMRQFHSVLSTYFDLRFPDLRA